MSGPKLSAAEIETQRRAQLEKERLERLRRLRAAQDTYSAASANVSELGEHLQHLLEDSIASICRVSIAGANMLSEKINQILARMQMNPIENSASEEAWINSAVESLKRANVLAAEGRTIIEEELNRIGVYNTRTANAKQQASVGRAIERASRQEIQIQRNLEFIPNTAEKLGTILSQRIHEMTGLLNSPQTPMRIAIEFLVDRATELQEIENSEADKAFDEKVQDIINREQDLIDEIDECKALYGEYCVLAAITNTEAIALAEVTDVNMLEKEMHDLKRRYQNKDELDYIADQVNQVMLSLGYDFVSSHVLQQETEQDMSVYGVDEKTGVVVYTGENGEVMMQVVSLGDSEEMSDYEIEDSLDMQLSFCAAHQDIVDELQNRGILLRQINYEPPAKSHARKISITQHSQESRKIVTRRKRRYEPRKAMRKL